MNTKLKIRENELKLIMDCICSGLAIELLDLKIILDIDKLVVSGHSFGGATALKVSHTDRRSKAVLTMDPWFFPFKKDLLKKVYYKF